MKTGTLFNTIIFLATGFLGYGAEDSGVAVTIYNDNFAVVKENRLMDFQKGVNTFRFTDVAERIDPTSVNFLCVNAPDAIKILEQNYEYDLVNTDSLLKRFLDKEITLLVKGSGAATVQLVQGTLLSSLGQDVIIRQSDGTLVILSHDSIQHISLSKAPEDLVTRPTLVWLVKSEKSGNNLCRVTYTTEGIGWRADYNTVLNDKENALDFSGWVTIENNSGAAYQDAGIKLIAGDVHRLHPQPRRPDSMMVRSAKMDLAGGEGFEEKAFMEYHLYTLGRKSTILNNQVKQIELIDPAINVPLDKKYIVEYSFNEWMLKHKDRVQVKLEFENKEEYGLGIALPKGTVRVFKKDPADDTLEFVGEDEIDHTPRKEKLSLYIGDAFDIVPEQKIIESRSGDSFITYTRQVELRNRKDEDVTVYVDELIPWRRNWRIEKKSHDYETRDAHTVRFSVKVSADQTVTLEYRMTQTW